jgi:hypothetical protein
LHSAALAACGRAAADATPAGDVMVLYIFMYVIFHLAG